MKKSIISIILLASLFLTGVACTGNPPAPNADTTTEPQPDSTTPPSDTTTGTQTENPTDIPATLDRSKEYSILFIGNSYTYYNDMPEQLFAKLMENAGYNVKVTSITKGGWYLIDSANSSDEVGAKVDSAFAKNKYDFVILQEQSTCPALDPSKFYTGVRNLVKKVIANGATPILYGTWGRKAGNSTLTQNNWTNESMTWMISAAYSAIAAELGIEAAYTGLAFYDVYTKNPSIELYHADKTHPSIAGSYLAALTIAAKLTGIDPTKLNYQPNIISEACASTLKEAARKAVFETPEIPAEYKVSSSVPSGNTSSMINLKSLPPQDRLISVLQGGTYPNGKNFSGILGTKGAVASTKYSLTGLSDADKADIADIGYGVSVIGIEKMFESAKGYTTAIENLVNGHWGLSFMSCFEFDGKHYNIKGEVDEQSPYIGLITLNFGFKHQFDAMGFSSGNLQGFPGAAEVYVSDDGVNWTIVPTACWDTVNGTKVESYGSTPADPWNGNKGTVTCLFDMGGVSGQYIRVGVIIGRNDTVDKYNTINTRELLVYGEKKN